MATRTRPAAGARAMTGDVSARRAFELPVDRARLDPAGLGAALALIEQVVGLPRLAAVMLARAIADGADGDVAVDAFNEVRVQVWRDAARSAPPSEYLSSAFDLWAGLTGALARQRGDAATITIRAFAPREQVVVRAEQRATSTVPASAAADGVLAALRALDAWGYRVPMPVAMALTAAALRGDRVELRATESVGRGWVVTLVEAHVGRGDADTDADAEPATASAPRQGADTADQAAEIARAFARWVETARPGPLMAQSWQDPASGSHFVDVWANDSPSRNWQAAISAAARP